MHPVDYTQIAADLIAIRDRVQRGQRLRDLTDTAALVALGSAAEAVLGMTEHHETPGWSVNDFEAVTWHEQDERFYPSRSGLSTLGGVDPATHVKIVWCDSADAHDERRTFYIRAGNVEHFGADFDAMIDALRRGQ